MNKNTILTEGRRALVMAAALFVGAWSMQSCKDDDVLEGQPAYLGNSIYESLQNDRNDKYTILLKLIDDLGQKEVLSHTGSKTLFAANDEAFEKWFQTNDWVSATGGPVRQYSDLTEAQRKLLLNNSMIDNAYLINLLGNVEGNPPMEGRAMRRLTSTSIYDSIYIMPVSEMPTAVNEDEDYWSEVRSRGKSVRVMMDATAPTTIHFLPAFNHYYNLTLEDLQLLTNGKAQSLEEVWFAGVKVRDNVAGQDRNRNITCKNGYIHKIDAVIEPTQNMAEIIHRDPETQLWSKILDRFSTPVPASAAIQREYNRIYEASDSVFVKRFFSRRSAGSATNSNTPLTSTWPEGKLMRSPLKFDPGWNQYIYNNTMDYDLHYDCGAMLVPTDEALLEWWNSEGGKVLQEEYGSLDNVPLNTLLKLLNVNMLENFTSAPPSLFATKVLNDAKDVLGVTKDDIRQNGVVIGTNGIVYKLNKLYGPAIYNSVAYPALAHESTMNTLYWAISTTDNDNKKAASEPYLLSMDTKYSMLLPTNEALSMYVDPATYGQTQPALIWFYVDSTKSSSNELVQALHYDTRGALDNLSKRTNPRTLGRKQINTRLDDLMRQLIIVGDITDGHEFYKTKDGCLIRVFKTPETGDTLLIQGGWQMETGKALRVTASYNANNGRSYQIEQEPPMSASRSVKSLLAEKPEYKAFYDLLNHEKNGMLSSTLTISESEVYNCVNGTQNFTLLDNYNYTVFVPTNESINALHEAGLLPNWDDYDAQTEEIWGTEARADSVREVIAKRIGDFIRYHVMDHSIAVNMAPEDKLTYGDFESMMRNPETGRFYPITVDYSDGEMKLTAAYNNQVSNVVKTEGLYNNVCREFWFNGKVSAAAVSSAASIVMTSDAVVHLIDRPLQYAELTDWRK